MRCAACLTFIVLFASCKSLKPVIGSGGDNAGNQTSASPRFIESITINSSSTNSSFKQQYVVDRTDYSKAHEAIAPLNIASGNNSTYITPLQIKYAILMDVAVEELTNFKLLSFMEDWYGTRYRFGGNDKDGVDCSAFSSFLLSNVFGIELPRMAKDQYRASQRIRRKRLEEGDLVFFHTTRKGVSHVGVYLGNNKFVHASLNYGVTISDLNDPYYSRTFIGAGRMKQNQTTASSAN